MAVPADERAAVLTVLDGLRHGGARIRPARPTGRPGFRRRYDRAPVVQVCWPVTDTHGRVVLGFRYACEIEFWRRAGDLLTAPRPNPVADVVSVDEPATEVPEAVLSPFSRTIQTGSCRTRPVFAMTAPDRVRFPIDVVYTWVDGGDPDWQARKSAALADNPWVATVNGQAANHSRFVSRDELRYSLRSLHCFAPWVRRIFIVTDDQLPPWLNVAHEAITIVSHREIFGTAGRLPTFNSQAIEARLHHIPDLAEHFLYLNDDVFFGRPVTPELFFTPGGLTRFFTSSALIGSQPRTADDAPVNQAGKNNRTLIEQAFGCRVTRKMMHTPHPSRRSTLEEIEKHFPAELAATAEHQFRHPDDVALLSSLQQYWGYLTGAAVPGRIRYLYTDVAHPGTALRLAALLRLRHLDVFCINDTDSDAAAAPEQARLLAEFLPAYFPFRSPYELAGPADRPATVPTPNVGRQISREPIAVPQAVPAGAAPPGTDVPSQPDRTGAAAELRNRNNAAEHRDRNTAPSGQPERHSATVKRLDRNTATPARLDRAAAATNTAPAAAESAPKSQSAPQSEPDRHAEPNEGQTHSVGAPIP